MENAFEVLLEKIENGQKNGMGRTGQVYVLGMVTYALERADISVEQAKWLRDRMGGAFSEVYDELEKVEF